MTRMSDTVTRPARPPPRRRHRRVGNLRAGTTTSSAPPATASPAAPTRSSATSSPNGSSAFPGSPAHSQALRIPAFDFRWIPANERQICVVTVAGNDEMRVVAREGALLAGGARAILLQVAHPAVGRGVAEHSDFADRPLDRLRATLTYVYAVTYGTPEEARAVASMVTGAHRAVTGAGYRASDPELQLWVAATLYDTAVLVYEELFGRLDGPVADKVYEQYAVLGTALQLPADRWPADRAAFRRYWADMVATLESPTTPAGWPATLLHPRRPLALRPAMPLNRFLTAAWLPTRMRQAYGIRWDERQQRRYDLLIRIGAVIYPRTARPPPGDPEDLVPPRTCAGGWRERPLQAAHRSDVQAAHRVDPQAVHRADPQAVHRADPQAVHRADPYGSGIRDGYPDPEPARDFTDRRRSGGRAAPPEEAQRPTREEGRQCRHGQAGESAPVRGRAPDSGLAESVAAKAAGATSRAVSVDPDGRTPIGSAPVPEVAVVLKAATGLSTAARGLVIPRTSASPPRRPPASPPEELEARQPEEAGQLDGADRTELLVGPDFRPVEAHQVGAAPAFGADLGVEQDETGDVGEAEVDPVRRARSDALRRPVLGRGLRLQHAEIGDVGDVDAGGGRRRGRRAVRVGGRAGGGGVPGSDLGPGRKGCAGVDEGAAALAGAGLRPARAE